MAPALEKTMKLCRGFNLFTTTGRMTRLWGVLVLCFAAALLSAPLGLSAQWLEYRGGLDGSFNTTCRTGAGDTSWSGEVTFTFSASENIATSWRGVQGAGKVAADGTASGSVRMLNGPIDWWGRFTRRSDGSIHGKGNIWPTPGEIGCTGTWIVEKAANPGQPNQPAAPATETAVCADYRTRIQRTEAELALYFAGGATPRTTVLVARRTLGQLNAEITSRKEYHIPTDDLEAKRRELYPHLMEAVSVVKSIEALENEAIRLKSQAAAAGCTQAEPLSPEAGVVDNEVDELLGLDSNSSDDIIRVAGVQGSVEMEMRGAKGPLRSGNQITLYDSVTIRTGPGSAVAIQVGSVRKTLRSNTTTRIYPRTAGKVDFLEEGGGTVDVRKPGAYQMKTPTATANVGGTVFTVSYNPTTRVTSVMVEEGRVTVRPTNPSVRGVTLAPGEYVEVSSNAMTAVLPAPGAPGTNVGGMSPGPNPTGISPVNPQGLDLTGLWKDDTGGGAIYHVRQVGNRVYWIVDGTPMGSFV
ncbi:MAG TPA: FecR family protein, partial [Gemmatimonadaceae bacterium]